MNNDELKEQISIYVESSGLRSILLELVERSCPRERKLFTTDEIRVEPDATGVYNIRCGPYGWGDDHWVTRFFTHYPCVTAVSLAAGLRATNNVPEGS